MDIKAYLATQLNEEQLKACLHTDSCSLIIAGAGSGKTRVLMYKIAYLVRGKNIPIQRILAVTFTNKAANEMKERLIKISEEMPALKSETKPQEVQKSDNDSITDFLESVTNNQEVITPQKLYTTASLKRIGTFHSIFLKILKEDIDKLDMKYNKNFWIYDTNESQSVIKEVLKKQNLQEVFKAQEVKSFISNQKNNWLDPKSCMKNTKTDYDQSMYKVYEAYQKALETSNSLDFDDLLLLPYMLFKKHPETLTKRKNRFDYILVDEAQDTNRIQFELIKMLSGDQGNVTLIWDDFQSIYGRRGALMENFLNVKMYRPDIQMFKLQTNYRSKPHIVSAGNHIIKNNVNQYKKEIVAHRTGDDKITIFAHASEIDEAANIVEMIRKMKEDSKIKTRWSIAILYRTNAQSSPFEQLFIQEGIPYKVRGAFKFFERKEIKDITSYIKYLVNPADNVSLKRIINIPNRKIWKTSIEKMEDYAINKNTNLTAILHSIKNWELEITPLAKGWIENFVETIDFIHSKLSTLRPAEVIETLVKKIKYRDYLVKEEWGEALADEKYENIWQLMNMAEKYVETWEETLRQFMEEVALLADISENEKWEIDAVKLMTVHSSKGLEFPVVFVAGLEDHIFPLSNAMMEPKLLEEERRLMYVAITRAKDVLFLSHAHSRMTRWQTKMNPPSRFLNELPAELIKKFDLGWWAERPGGTTVEEWDIVKHKLFGTGYVLEIWNNLAIVKFHNPKFGVRKIEMRFLDVI